MSSNLLCYDGMIEPKIVFRHPDWMLINKPEGMDVESLQLLWRNQFEHFHPVHRLDKDTSGLWLIALNAQANAGLSLKFQNREVKKCYVALCTKKPKKKQGKIVGDMLKSRRSQWRLSQSRVNPAVTYFQSMPYVEGLRLMICQPITGKTHQIRVAMKSLGSPIAGDSIYDKGNLSHYDRLYLHAYCLRFNWQGETYVFKEPPTTGCYFIHEKLRDDLDNIPLFK